MNFGFNNNVTLAHNSLIYITAIATNAAGLSAVAYSDPVLVDLTPPNIKYVYDGRGMYNFFHFDLTSFNDILFMVFCLYGGNHW